VRGKPGADRRLGGKPGLVRVVGGWWISRTSMLGFAALTPTHGVTGCGPRDGADHPWQAPRPKGAAPVLNGWFVGRCGAFVPAFRPFGAWFECGMDAPTLGYATGYDVLPLRGDNPARPTSSPTATPRRGQKAPPAHSPEGARDCSPGRSPGSRAPAPPPSTAPKGRENFPRGIAPGLSRPHGWVRHRVGLPWVQVWTEVRPLFG